MSNLLILSPGETRRFWSKVRQPDSPSECWVWTASTRGWDSQRKYGQFVRGKAEMAVQGGPRLYYAHRVAFCVAREWPLNYLTDELAILHDCDNPLCCNPAHLTLGTQLANIVDMIRKGRNRSGRRGGRPRVRAVQEIPA